MNPSKDGWLTLDLGIVILSLSLPRRGSCRRGTGSVGSTAIYGLQIAAPALALYAAKYTIFNEQMYVYLKDLERLSTDDE